MPGTFQDKKHPTARAGNADYVAAGLRPLQGARCHNRGARVPRYRARPSDEFHPDALAEVFPSISQRPMDADDSRYALAMSSCCFERRRREIRKKCNILSVKGSRR
jgi:hypothetical protein